MWGHPVSLKLGESELLLSGGSGMHLSKIIVTKYVITESIWAYLSILVP